jgi:hypothetical protein
MISSCEGVVVRVSSFRTFVVRVFAVPVGAVTRCVSSLLMHLSLSLSLSWRGWLASRLPRRGLAAGCFGRVGRVGFSRAFGVSGFSAVVGCVSAVLVLGVGSAYASGVVQVGSFGGEGSAAGQLREPRDIAVNETTHDVYVADTSNERVDEFTARGVFVLMFGKEVNKTKDGEAGASEAERNVCTEAEVQAHGVVCKAGVEGAGVGEFAEPKGVAVDNTTLADREDVYVADTANNRVEVYSSTGAYITEFDGGGTPEGSFSGPRGLTVDGEGDVYVADQGHGVVDKFSPLGAAFLPAPYLSGLANPRAVAVDSTLGSEAIYVANQYTNVEKFNYTTGASEGLPIDPADEHLFDVAVNTGTGDIYISEEEEVKEFSPAGVLLEAFGSFPELPATTVTVDSSTGTIFVVMLQGEKVGVFSSTVVPPTTVTGPATPHAGGVAVEGEVNPNSVAITECSFEYGTNTSYGQSAPCHPEPAEIGSGSTPQPVSAEITGLQPGTVYHYRLVAANANSSSQGQDRTFLTPAAPSINNGSVEDITASTADLTAQIDPNGADTTYRFEYGTSTAYGTSLPIPDGDIAAGTSEQTVTVHLTGLLANTVYHFRVIAQNAVGVTTGVDHTFVYTSASGLPDGRFYEQVSPVDKNFTDALGFTGVVEASPAGDGVTFYSTTPFPGVVGASGYSIYLSTRGGDGWLTQGLDPATDPGWGASVVGLTEDLSETIVEASEPSLAPGATPEATNFYIGDNATGVYRLLARGPSRLSFAGASSDDSRILFEDTAEELVPGVRDALRVPYLYEWDNGQITPVGVLPDGSAPAGGAAAGPGGSLIEHELGAENHGGAADFFYTQDTISEDGSRVFFSDIGTGRIYVREPQAERTIPVSEGEAYWRTATPDGRFVFYTEGEGKESNLYRFDVESKTREALTSGKTDVRGTLGVSDDGAYVYFAAGESAGGLGNLYEWHDGATTLVSGGLMQTDWATNVASGQGTQGAKSSRVTPEGMTVLFSSWSQLTGYDNAGHNELYLFDAVGGTLTCVSCNPSGIPATSDAETAVSLSESGADAFNSFLTRNLSADGRRVFFDTKEALVPQDTNGQRDVYEWEAYGAGSCESESQNGGCLYLISTGQSASPSYFGDMSADGNDVFFFTRQALVGQDQDSNSDIYDARVGGGIAAQNPATPPAPCAGEACLATPGASPVFGVSSSAVFSGTGNLPPPTSTPTTKAKAKALTGPQKLAKALKACRREPKKKRAVCEAQARKRYPGKSKARQAGRSAGTRKSSGRHHS